MNRVVWLPAIILLAIVATGCQSTKFPSPKWPDFAMFKKKDKELAPPSEHFDVAEQTQLAGTPSSERKRMEIPGEASAEAVKAPADLAKPTASMVAGKSNSTPNSGAPERPGTSPSATQPIRKPYEIARSGAEGVKQAAESLASDIEKSSQAAAEQVSRNANEVVGQFQQQGRDLAAAANNSVNQAANNLNQKANNALNAIAPPTPSANPAASGGAFAFSRPTSNSPPSTASPPWTAASTPAASMTSSGNGSLPPASPSPIAPPASQVDPLKSLSASSALPPPSSSPATLAVASGFNPKPAAGSERQLQPINQQMVNQNLGSAGASPANSPTASPASAQFQLPVAQPPAFLANRTTAPAATSSNSTAPAEFAPQNKVAPEMGANKYPATGFNAFSASGSQSTSPPPSTSGNAAPTPPIASQSGFNPSAAKVNADWQNQASPISASSSATEAAATRPVSHNAELPAELMQRSGGYAPGSISESSNAQTLWR